MARICYTRTQGVSAFWHNKLKRWRQFLPQIWLLECNCQKVVKLCTMVQQLIVILAICKSLREEIFSSEVVVECDWQHHLIGLNEFDWHHHGPFSRFRVTLRPTIFSSGRPIIITHVVQSIRWFLWSRNLQIRTSVLKPYQHPPKLNINDEKNHLETHCYFTSCLRLGLQWVRSVGLGFCNLFSISFSLIQRPILLRFCV